MNRDKLDNELRSRLGDARVSPPSDMWDRIVATLQREGLTAVAPAAKPSVTIRRPRRLRLGYAAAAAILVCALVFGLRQFDFGGGLAVVQDDPVQDMPFVVITPDQIDDLIADATVVQERPRIVMVMSHPSGLFEPAEETPMIEIPALEWNEDPAVFATVDIHDKTDGDDDTHITEWVDPAEIERLLGNGEQKTGKRSKRRISVGLFSSNIGKTSSEKTVNTPTVRTASSSLTVTETTNGIFSSPTSAPARTRLQHKMPLSAGISLSMGLTDRLSAESGATYTYMLSKSQNPSRDINGTKSVSQELHYVGVPIGMKYDFVQGGRINLYASASALFEMCVSGKQTTKVEVDGIPSRSASERLNARGIQPSVGVHAGAEVKITNRLALYLEPGVNYYFETDRQPESYRTENPLNLSLRAGLRVRLQ